VFNIYRLWKEQHGRKAKHLKARDKMAKPKLKTSEKLATHKCQTLKREPKINKG
jgi:hypothetical protein